MVNFISSESRGQTRFIEESVERLQEILKNKDVIKKLGHVAEYMYELTENMYVPDIVNKQVVIPQSHIDSNDTPLIALHPWSTVSLDTNFAIFTPQREARALQILDELEPTDGNSEEWLRDYQTAMLRHAQRTQETRSVRGSEAMCAARASGMTIDSNEFRATDATRVHFIPRSMLVLRRRHSPVSPPTFAHELFHKVQRDARPPYVSDGMSMATHTLKAEREAYSVGAKIAITMLDAGQKITAHDELGIQIDRGRAAINKKHL